MFGLIQRPGPLRLGPEPGQRLRLLDVLGQQQLDRNPPSQDEVRGTPDLAVAAGGDTVVELVAAVKPRLVRHLAGLPPLLARIHPAEAA